MLWTGRRMCNMSHQLVPNIDSEAVALIRCSTGCSSQPVAPVASYMAPAVWSQQGAWCLMGFLQPAGHPLALRDTVRAGTACWPHTPLVQLVHVS